MSEQSFSRRRFFLKTNKMSQCVAKEKPQQEDVALTSPPTCADSSVAFVPSTDGAHKEEHLKSSSKLIGASLGDTSSLGDVIEDNHAIHRSRTGRDPFPDAPSDRFQESVGAGRLQRLRAKDDVSKISSTTIDEHSAAKLEPSTNYLRSSQSALLIPDEPERIETLESHLTHSSSLLTRVDPGSSSPADTVKAKKSKLRKAAMAVLLFRRSTSSPVTTSQTNQSASNASSPKSHHRTHPNKLSYPKSLVASIWRQSTADSSACKRPSRANSLSSQADLRESSSPNLTNGDLLGQLPVSSPSKQNSTHPSNSSFAIPRFIVPKMNTLRLPIVCLIKSLDGKIMHEAFVHRYELGQYLMDSLKVSQGILDAKYLGLRLAKSLEDQEDISQPWLDLNESVYKQISKHSKMISANDSGHRNANLTCTRSVDLYLRIKFYPPNLSRIQDQFLRNYLFLQLRRDLRLGKLSSAPANLAYLMAYSFQYDLGDYKPEHINENLPNINILPDQDKIEREAIEIWRNQLSGTKPHQVQMKFLRASVIMQTYGFDFYPVRDHQRQRGYLLGFNYAGIKTIRGGYITHHFRWHNLTKISYERRMIIFHIHPDENSKRKQILGFKCLSNDDCQTLYIRLLEQKYFFTVDLTYFDKTIRRPSYLNDSSVSEQQLSSWTSSNQPSPQMSDQFECEDREDVSRRLVAPANTSSPDQQRHEPQQNGGKYMLAANQEQQTREFGHVTGRTYTGSDLNNYPSGKDLRLVRGSSDEYSSCDCIQCKQHTNNRSMESTSTCTWAGHSDVATRNAYLIKSSSLQEPAHGRKVYTRDRFQKQTNLSDVARCGVSCCGESEVSIKDQRPLDSQAENVEALPPTDQLTTQATLRRQPSMLNHAAEHDAPTERAGSLYGDPCFKPEGLNEQWTQSNTRPFIRTSSQLNRPNDGSINPDNFTAPIERIVTPATRSAILQLGYRAASIGQRLGGLASSAVLFYISVKSLEYGVRFVDMLAKLLTELLTFRAASEDALSPRQACAPSEGHLDET